VQVNVLTGGYMIKNKMLDVIPLKTYYASQEDDQEPQEIGLFTADDAGLLAACSKLLGQLGYTVYRV
jgi:hypothetical protein